MNTYWVYEDCDLIDDDVADLGCIEAVDMAAAEIEARKYWPVQPLRIVRAY